MEYRVITPEDSNYPRKLKERLGDIVFIPYGPKGSKTYATAKKVVEANIPVFTTDHLTSSDLHKLGIPGFNRKTVKKFLEDKGAKLPVIEDMYIVSEIKHEPSDYKADEAKKPKQEVLDF